MPTDQVAELKDSRKPIITVAERKVADIPRRLRRMLALDDFEAAARRHLPRPIFGYVSGACETGASFSDNRSAFGERSFVPRALLNVGTRSQSRSLLGVDYAHPFGIGYEINTGGHTFHMNFTNASGIVENQYIADTRDSWFDGKFKWGFNISRIFMF